jgi:hypothetical protein
MIVVHQPGRKLWLTFELGCLFIGRLETTLNSGNKHRPFIIQKPQRIEQLSQRPVNQTKKWFNLFPNYFDDSRCQHMKGNWEMDRE